MDSFDLDIDNYDLKDILTLFNISFNFDEHDLKTCKKTVHMSHPDKSGLDKDYFLFFCKAYNILVNIFNFKNKKHTNTNYKNDEINKDKYEAIRKFTNSDNFLEEFNKLFEENKMSNEFSDNGYGEWLQQETNKDILELNNKHLSKSEQLKKITQLKQKTHEIIEYENIKELQTMNDSCSHLTNNKPNSYGNNNIFSSNLQFEDLKVAHETSLIPVLDSDKRKHDYKNIGQLQFERKQQIRPLSKKESIQYLNNRDKQQEIANTNRAFKLAKQSQEAEYIKNKTDGYFNRITY